MNTTRHNLIKLKRQPRPMDIVPQSQSYQRQPLKQRLVRLLRTVYIIAVTLTLMLLVGYILCSARFTVCNECVEGKTCARVQVQHSQTQRTTCSSLEYCQRLELKESMSLLHGGIDVCDDTLRIGKQGMYLIQSVVFYDRNTSILCNELKQHHSLYITRGGSNTTRVSSDTVHNCHVTVNVSYTNGIKHLDENDQVFVTFPSNVSIQSGAVSFLELVLLQ